MGTRSFGCPAAGLSLCLNPAMCQRGSVSRQNQEKSRCERPCDSMLADLLAGIVPEAKPCARVRQCGMPKSRTDRTLGGRSLLLIPELDTQMLPNALLRTRIRHHAAIHDFTELEHGIPIRYCQRELHMLLDQ